MAWTKEQNLAIYKRNSNIIVSAGAGSGKTAVLSERILELVKEGNSINDILVLTFTNAAAAEMKNRIYKKLLKAGLTEEANLCHSAYITTFDAFSLAMVKKYYYLLGVDPNIKVGNELVINNEKRRIIENLFLGFYESDYAPFLNFLRHYSLKDDTNVIDLMLSISNKLDLLPDSKKYLDEYITRYYNKTFLDNLCLEYEKIVLDKLDDIISDLDDLKFLNYDYPDYASKLEDAIYPLKNAKCYEDVILYLADFKIPMLKRGSSEEIKKLKASITDELKDFKKNYLEKYSSKKEMLEALESTKADMEFIIEICKEIDTAIYDYKNAYQAFTFTDIAKMAIKLVKEFPSVKEDFKGLKEILVDEYQDTSDLQEEFLLQICNNNMYMVGDIKQSIYRFRNANPYIFKNKYDKYSNNEDGLKIDLLHNFRSRKEVLEDINNIFSSLMTDTLGDADYKESHQMNFGLLPYEKDKPDYNYHLDNLVYELPKKYEYNRVEIEAFIAARKIKEIVSNALVFDKDTQEMRKAKYSDIAILIDRGTSFPVFEKIFSYLGIPLAILADLDLKNSSFTLTMINLLKLTKALINKEYDKEYERSLAGVLRSFIFNLSDEEIYKIIREKQENPLVNTIREIDFNLSSVDLFYELLDRLGVYSKMPMLGNINNTLAEISNLADILKGYNDLGYDFSLAVEFLDEIFAGDTKLRYTPLISGSDEVKLMTMHHSKGLEYPFVILPLLDKSFNQRDLQSQFGFDIDLGIYLPASANGIKDTILRTIINNSHKTKDISEEVRLLYVALTRAREKLILIHEQKEFKERELKSNNLKSFASMLKRVDYLDSLEALVPLDSLNLTKDYLILKEGSKLKSNNEDLIYSLNDDRGSLIDKGAISKHITKVLSANEQKTIEMGLHYHELLENLDLHNPDYSNLKEEEASKLKNILAMDIFKDIKEAKFYQEHEFYFVKDGKSYNGIIDLLLEYKDRYVIIDYKLANLDSEEYVRQLTVYHDYLVSLGKTNIKMYLLSIMHECVKEIKL